MTVKYMRSSMLRQEIFFLWILMNCFIEHSYAQKLRPHNTHQAYNFSTIEKIRAFAIKNGTLRPEVWLFFFFVFCIGVRYFCKGFWNRVAPPDTLLQELQLDDIRIERFDGIEHTLYNRLRDPFGYSPMNPLLQEERERNGYDDAADKYLGRNTAESQDAFDVREAADLLRSRAKGMVYSLTGAGETGSSIGSTSMPTIAQQESMRKKLEGVDEEVFAANWDARTAKDREKALADGATKESLNAAHKERDLLESKERKAREKSDDPYRHAKGGAQGRGGGSQWDAWGDESGFEGGREGVADGKDVVKGTFEQKEHKAGSYHVQAADKKESGGEQFSSSRNVGGFSVAGGDQWASVRGRNPPSATATPAISAAGGSFTQGSGKLARQNTMQGNGDMSAWKASGGEGEEKTLRRSPDKKGGLTLDLARIPGAPPSIKVPPPIKYDVPIAPSNVPRPGSSTENSRPSMGGNSNSNGNVKRPNPSEVPLPPQGIMAPVGPRGRSSPQTRPGTGGNSYNNRLGVGMEGMGMGSPGSPIINTLKMASYNDSPSDDGGGYSMDVRGEINPFPSKTSPGGGSGSMGSGFGMGGMNTSGPLGGQRVGVAPGPPRGAPPASLGAVSAVAGMGYPGPSRGPPRGAPPAYTGGPVGMQPRPGMAVQRPGIGNYGPPRGAPPPLLKKDM